MTEKDKINLESGDWFFVKSGDSEILVLATRHGLVVEHFGKGHCSAISKHREIPQRLLFSDGVVPLHDYPYVVWLEPSKEPVDKPSFS